MISYFWPDTDITVHMNAVTHTANHLHKLGIKGSPEHSPPEHHFQPIAHQGKHYLF